MSVPTDEQRKELLLELQRVEKLIRSDLLTQYRSDPGLMQKARARLAEEENSPSDIEAWLQTFAGRAAVLYILKTLYVRVLEDQKLIQPVRIRSGGAYELFSRLFPNLGLASYLRRVFDDVGRLLPELFAYTPVEIAQPGESGARELWAVWQSAAEGGGLRFDFQGNLDTRFIGDLYQDLDPDVKKRYALLQTPRFIEQFILDRTLQPALDVFSLDDFRIIDPTCGSGHFLVGAFQRLAKRWRERLPNSPEGRWEATTRALAAVHGVDLNEYACALSRFRLLLAAVQETGVNESARLCNLHFNVIACDSLIPWERIAQPLPGMADYSWLASYGSPDERARNENFFARGFHCVVGNPPYIAVADQKKRDDYRRAWPLSASGHYSLSSPMTERFFSLALKKGVVGLIVGNNFCKRSFGRGLVQKVFPNIRIDLVVDTSGAYIPGHGTPTNMIFGRQEKISMAEHQVRIVAGKQGEPTQPSNPAAGAVWTSIASHYDLLGYSDRWISVQDSPQSLLCKHPWSLGDGVTSAVLNILRAFPTIQECGGDVGRALDITEDDAFVRRYAHGFKLRELVRGESVKDWTIESKLATVLFPYDTQTMEIESVDRAEIDLWPLRTTLSNRKAFAGGTYAENHLPWWQFHQLIARRLRASEQRIVMAETATHSHFTITERPVAYARSAPVLTFGEQDGKLYRCAVAALNSSTLEFWFKQVCFKKGGDVVGEGRVPGEPWDVYFVRNAANVLKAPVPAEGTATRASIANQIEAQINLRTKLDPARVISESTPVNLQRNLADARAQSDLALEMLVSLQEELDWSVYRAFGLVDEPPLQDINHVQPLARGHRPFEIALARRAAAGEEETAWFERHSLTPVIAIPERYTGRMRHVLERRITMVESDEVAGLLEQPVYKRRWQIEPWDDRVNVAAESWLLDRLEAELKKTRQLLSLDELVSRLSEPKVRAVVPLMKLDTEASDADSIKRLLDRESIPDNAARLFSPQGLKKYIGAQTAFLGRSGGLPDAQPFADGEPVDWKRVWRLQEREDAGEAMQIAVPPPFARADYAHPNGWRLRSKFNVPNERFIVFDELRPLRYSWGGWTTAERATLSLEAFELRGRQPDGATMKPTTERPERCGIQFPLWDKIDELRRVADTNHTEVQEIAQLCERACPCDVLERWRGTAVRRNGRARASTASKARHPELQEGLPIKMPDAAAIDRLVELLEKEGAAGLGITEFDPLFIGDRQAARDALEALRASGRVEAVGKGRRIRYRIPQTRLL